MIVLRLSVIVACVAFALTSGVSAAQPAPAAAPAAPAAAPAAPPPGAGVNAAGTRYDWQGNHKKAQAALAARDYKTAIQLFTEILNSGRLPKAWLATTLYLRGKAYRSSRQYREAVTDYEAAVQTDPKLHPAFFELGATYHSQQQYAKAVSAFGQAIALKSDQWNYYDGRCTSLASMSRWGDAIRDCEAAVRLKPGNANLIAFLGRLYEESGQKQRAIEMYKLALSINPSQADAKEGLAQLQK
jgi:tetratricopeptide (TPR) repeat protein